MPTIGRMRRRYAKSMMKRLGEGGSFVSDVERQQMEQGLQQGATAALGAQQMQLGQAARAQTGGGVFQQAPFQEAQKGVASQAAEAAVKATGQQRLMESQLADARRGQVLGMAGELHDINRQNAAGAMQALQWFVELPSDTFGSMMGSAKQFGGPA